jgi:hypothetical protein
MLILKIIFLNKKYIILIYFQVKNILKPFYPIKKSCCYTVRHCSVLATTMNIANLLAA